MKLHTRTTGATAGMALFSILAACGCSSTLEPDAEPEPVPEEPLEIAAAIPEPEPVEEPAEPQELPPREFPYELIEGEPMFTVVPKDGIPAIDAPVFVSASEAAAFMKDDETVLGVVGRDGTAKCYSAWQLDSHEIVNDTLDGTAIAATW